MPNYDDPTVPYDSAITYDAVTPNRFLTPTDDIVPPIYMFGPDPWYPVDPCMQRLMRHYRNQTRGRNIFKLSDGTFVDSQVGGTPPNMIQPPTDPYVRSYTPDANGNAVETDTFQVPYVVRTYYGGTNNFVTPAEAAALEAAGYTVTT